MVAHAATESRSMEHDEVLARVTVLARALGLACTPRVLADRSNLVLALEPHPLVARVAMATSAARVGMAWLRREVEVSRFLGPALATQPATSIPAGPHEVEGLVVSFWQREVLHGAVDPRAAGLALAACHRALASYPTSALPHLGAWDEVRGIAARAIASPLLEASERGAIERGIEQAERILEEAPRRSASMQAVHGDAHLGNVLATERGMLWTDWEDAFVGPIEYDLACLRSRAELFGEQRDEIEAACAAYDVPHDADLVRELGHVRNVQVIVWLAIFAERQPELAPRLRARIEKLAPVSR
jgi:aminoglycoside phosphotransferase (APT) family kinase protein